MTRRGPELWSWLGDHLAVDFANTVRVVDGRREELVSSTALLRDWYDREADRLPARPTLDEEARARFVVLRDAALDVMHAACAHQALPASAVEQVDAAVLEAGVSRLLAVRSGESAYVSASGTTPLAACLGRLAAAVVELVATDDLAGIAVCPAPVCGQFFHRGRPNQRWCSAGCGNRARVDRHRHRRSSDQPGASTTRTSP